jgi:hypothetical protein
VIGGTEGGNCDTSYSVIEAEDNFPAEFIREISATYQGQIIRLESKRTGSPEFNFVLATANDVPVCHVDMLLRFVLAGFLSCSTADRCFN